ncbi:MAG: hypothetical protein JSV97_13460 [candidate division WOR-3 bacterium]|nr:MAG: hypothetical protein JSV97_13460 [candidate division WOR-3 bacterium]
MSWIIILIVIGVFFWLTNLHVLVLSRDWPLILIFLGIVNLLHLTKRDKRKKIIRDLESGKINTQQAEKRLKEIT